MSAPEIAKPQPEQLRIGVFVCHCGSNIAGVVDVEEVVDFARKLPGVVYASDQMFSCAGNTQKEIEGITQQIIEKYHPDKIT